MNKIYLFAFVALLSVGLLASSSYASMGKGGSMTFNNQNLIGAVVKDSHGKALGVISRVFTEKRDNAGFALVVRWIHDQYGRERTITSVPIAALRISEMKSGKVGVVFNGTEKKLGTALFDPGKLGQPGYDASVYRHYGISPSWTEMGTSKK